MNTFLKNNESFQRLKDFVKNFTWIYIVPNVPKKYTLSNLAAFTNGTMWWCKLSGHCLWAKLATLMQKHGGRNWPGYALNYTPSYDLYRCTLNQFCHDLWHEVMNEEIVLWLACFNLQQGTQPCHVCAPLCLIALCTIPCVNPQCAIAWCR